jgi:hypothetical protein
MARPDGDPRPDAASPSRRARRKAESSAPPSTDSDPTHPEPRPSPYGAPDATGAPVDAGHRSPYQATEVEVPARSRREARGKGPRTAPSTPPRARRGLKLHTAMIGVGTVAALGFASVVVISTKSQAESPMTRINFAPVGTWAWYNDKSLGKTDALDQYAQASVSGLKDGDHNAGFFLRYTSRSDRVRIAVSGTVWRIEPSGGTPVTGEFPHDPSGTFRAEAQGQTVRIIWNGQLVTEQTLPRTYNGHAVLATVWQSSPAVRMTNLEASSLDVAGRGPLPRLPGSITTDSIRRADPSTASASAGPATSKRPSATSSTSAAAKARPAGRRGWFSGAASTNMADGGFDRWRGTASGIAGTWDDQTPQGQTELYSICGGQYREGSWNKKLDMAIGAIFKKNGESWEAAADGAYDARWRQALTRAKQCWGSRNADNLYLRFGHELNLSGSDWGVQAGQEGSFRQALTRFSNIRYQVFPGVNIVLSVNDGTSGGMADVRKLNPGRDGQGRRVIDVYGADSYNAWPHCTTVAACQAKFNKAADDGGPLGIETHRKLAQQWGVPFSINEWSNNGEAGNSDGGGEAPAYMQAFHGWAKSHAGDTANPKAGQFLYEVLFNLWDAYHLFPTDVQPQTAEAYRSLPWGRI